MTAIRNIRRILLVMMVGAGLEGLAHRSMAIVSGALFALGLVLFVAFHALLVIVGAAFVAIPAILGILTMEIRPVRH